MWEPTTEPLPGTYWNTPLGMPASTKISAILAAITVDVSAGFNKVQLPVTKAATVIPTAIAKGKFQGEITRAKPRG